MKDKALRLVKAISNESVKRIPYIIAVGLIIGIFAGVKSYNKTAESVRVAKNNSEQVAHNTEAIKKNTAALAESVKDLKRDNAQQTQILCQIILRGDVSLSDEEAAEIEAICKSAIDKINQEAGRTPSNPGQNNARPSKSDPGESPAAGSSPQSAPNNQPPQSNNSQPLIVVPPLPQPCVQLGRLQLC